MEYKQLEYDARKRGKALAYLAWLFFGPFGAHRFYLKRVGSAAIMLALTITPWIGVFMAGLLGTGTPGDPFLFISGLLSMLWWIVIPIWMIVDAFLIPGMVERYNVELVGSLTVNEEHARLY